MEGKIEREQSKAEKGKGKREVHSCKPKQNDVEKRWTGAHITVLLEDPSYRVGPFRRREQDHPPQVYIDLARERTLRCPVSIIMEGGENCITEKLTLGPPKTNRP
jgi:hypothetical protein